MSTTIKPSKVNKLKVEVPKQVVRPSQSDLNMSSTLALVSKYAKDKYGLELQFNNEVKPIHGYNSAQYKVRYKTPSGFNILMQFDTINFPLCGVIMTQKYSISSPPLIKPYVFKDIIGLYFDYLTRGSYSIITMQKEQLERGSLYKKLRRVFKVNGYYANYAYSPSNKSRKFMVYDPKQN